MKDAGQHADDVGGDDQSDAWMAAPAVAPALCGSNRAPPNGLRDVVRPPLDLAPSPHLEDVPEDKREGQHAGDPLQRIADVARIGIVPHVPLAAEHDHHADQPVKEDRQEHEAPFEEEEGGRADGVDLVGPALIGGGAVEHGGVGEQVEAQDTR